MRISALILVIIGVLIALLSPVSFIYGVVGAILSVVGAILQFYLSRSFVAEFTENDWDNKGDEYTYTVPSGWWRSHGTAPVVYLFNGSTYEVVGCDQIENPDGSFTLKATQPFQGRLVLK